MTVKNLNENHWLLSLPPVARQEMLKVAKLRQYSAAQRIHGKSDSALGLYGVIEGGIRISSNTLSGEEIVFTRIEEGQWFGELALLDGGDRTHDAHVTVDSTIAILPQAPLLRVCREYPEVYQALVKLLCDHCRQAYSAIDDFLLFTPAQRLAKQIVAKLQLQSSNHLLINQQELGALIGISRQSTNKILKTWEKNGWIKRAYRGLDIISPDSLRATY